MTYSQVTYTEFRSALLNARRLSDRIRAMTTAPRYLPEGARYYLASDNKSGFGINGSELIAVFSREQGRGDAIVYSAIENGARKLDCFDGYLTEFYGRHGFTEDYRVANWSPGGPDVVFMSHKAYSHADV